MKRNIMATMLSLGLTAVLLAGSSIAVPAATIVTWEELQKQKEEAAAEAEQAAEELNESLEEAAEKLEEVIGETQETAEEGAETEDDQAAADEVADLIDAIYVQERTDETDAQCAAAREAWDALTDAQKELVEGENADPDYFGRDTGDASKDDPRNADEIGENELLVVSFGTSFNDSRAEDIGGIEAALEEAYPDWAVRRAFTAQIIINHVQARDGEFIDNMDQALERAVANGVKNLVVQPTHLMQGAEYDELCEALESYADEFESVAVAKPLLGDVGEDETVVNEDKEIVAKAVVAQAVEEAGYADLNEAEADGVAFVFMGHGTAHKAAVTYDQMNTQMQELGYKNVYIGTVEGEPEDTACDAVIEAIQADGYKKVILRPLMVVAGDHANNDMAGDDEDSWKSMFTASGAFDSVDCQIAGLGRIADVQQVYVAHTGEVIDGAEAAGDGAETEAAAALEDGVYSAEFDTDSSMFHVNEANKDRGVLTVKDGQMTIHVSLASQNIVNLFCGSSEEAQQEGAELLQPTTDTVTYEDGTTEEVYGFDIPVPVLDEPFAVALIGTKEKWYDHEVTVTDVQPAAEDGDAEAAGAAEEGAETEDDQAAADEVAALIDAIYVQERTDETDAQCAAAREAWDALTDAQKELVEGENADPDYFGRDTGDASKDDPRNADEIGENELLVVSFGTSFNDSRAEDIGGIEAALEEAYPDWAVRRAFTAQIIINHVQARDGEFIDNMDQALERAVANGVKNLVVQPTHLMQGAEYDELCEALESYADEFESVAVAKPLLGDVGEDETVVNEDKEIVAKAVVAQAVEEAGYADLNEAEADGVAFVFMGHGTAHKAAVTYDQMNTQMQELGYKNVYIGTVEGEPEDTACDAVIEAIQADGYKKVILRPLMVVAGDHANNDMAGDDEDSWKSMFTASGAFDSVDCQIAGLGRIADVQQVYVAHTGEVIG